MLVLLHKTLFAVFALSVPVAGLVVEAQLIWCAIQSLRAARIGIAATSVLAVVGLAALFVAVALVWFGYGVAHSQKDIRSDLTIMLVTALPFYAACFAFWRLAGYLQAVLRRRGAQQQVPADVPAPSGRQGRS